VGARLRAKRRWPNPLESLKSEALRKSTVVFDNVVRVTGLRVQARSHTEKQ
jgi:hypothetical protein